MSRRFIEMSLWMLGIVGIFSAVPTMGQSVQQRSFVAPQQTILPACVYAMTYFKTTLDDSVVQRTCGMQFKDFLKQTNEQYKSYSAMNGFVSSFYGCLVQMEQGRQTVWAMSAQGGESYAGVTSTLDKLKQGIFTGADVSKVANKSVSTIDNEIAPLVPVCNSWVETVNNSGMWSLLRCAKEAVPKYKSDGELESVSILGQTVTVSENPDLKDRLSAFNGDLQNVLKEIQNKNGLSTLAQSPCVSLKAYVDSKSQFKDFQTFQNSNLLQDDPAEAKNQDDSNSAPAVVGQNSQQDSADSIASPQKSNAGNGYYTGGGNQAPSGHTKDRLKNAGRTAAMIGAGTIAAVAPVVGAIASQGGGSGGASPAAAGGGGNPVGAGGAAPGATDASAGAGGSAGQQMSMGAAGAESIKTEEIASIQSGVQTAKVDPNNPLGAQTNSGTNTNTAGTKLDPNKLQSGKNTTVSNGANNAQGTGVTGAGNTAQQGGTGATTVGGKRLFDDGRPSNGSASLGSLSSGGGYIMPGYGMQRGYGGSGESEPGASLDYNDTRRQDTYQKSGSRQRGRYVPANAANSAELVDCSDKVNLESNPVCATRLKRIRMNRQEAMSLPLLNDPRLLNNPNRRGPSGHSGH